MSGSAARHFASLAAAGCESFLYHNFEGVPEALPTSANELPQQADAPPGGPSTNPFTQIELFKRSEVLVPRRTEGSAHAALEAWRKRTRAGKFFLYYESGKCACRVDTDGCYVPVSVHACLPRKLGSGEWDEPRLRACVWTNDPRNETARHVPGENSAILHYPVWDPAALWHKYRLHGDFPNTLVSGKTHKRGLDWGDCFHTECRDAYLAAKDDGDGGYGAMLSLFRRAAMLPDAAEADVQIDMGLLTRLRHAVTFLSESTAGSDAVTHAGKLPQQQRPLLQQPPPRVLSPAEERPGSSFKPKEAPAAASSAVSAAAPSCPAAEDLMWTAVYVQRIEQWQLHGLCAVERSSWRAPKRWHPQLAADDH